MKIVKVKTGIQEYEVMVGSGLLQKAGKLLADLGYDDKAVIITDETVNKLYGASLKENLAERGLDVKLIALPTGEEQKSLDTAAMVYSQLTDFYTERSTPIIALGGGVIGDLAGFVAATYMRGVPLIQMPTTLLAQGDSSIGGKVAVNHGSLKNKIGAFYQPRGTISDIDTLKSLSPRELSNGLAEVIKHGIILDSEFFNYLESNMAGIKSHDGDVLEKVVALSARIKAGVVEKDELDLGLRNILNFGHTVGHAIESVSELKIWHGEAVAIGMMAEARISEQLGLLTGKDLERITELISRAGLPIKIPAVSRDKLLRAMKHDKKNVKGKIKFVLPKKIGEVIVTDEVDQSVIERALDGSDA